MIWDGSGLGGGLHDIDLEAHDEAGNESGASFTVSLVLPTPTPTDKPTKTPVPTDTPEPPSLFDLFSAATATATAPPGASPTSVRSPTATRTPLTISFGAGGPPPAPLAPGGDGSTSSSPSSFQPTTSSPSLLSRPGVYYGGAALALGAAAAVYAADQRRKRKEEEARQREEMARLNAEAEALDRARAQQIAEAREEAEWKKVLAGIIAAAGAANLMRKEEKLDPEVQAAMSARDQRLTAKEERLDPRVPEAPQGAWRQGGSAGFQTYQESERLSIPAVPQTGLWWQKAWEDVKDARANLIDWVDQNQTVLSIAAGAGCCRGRDPPDGGDRRPVGNRGPGGARGRHDCCCGDSGLERLLQPGVNRQPGPQYSLWTWRGRHRSGRLVAGDRGHIAAIGGTVGTTVATACMRFPTACRTDGTGHASCRHWGATLPICPVGSANCHERPSGG